MPDSSAPRDWTAIGNGLVNTCHSTVYRDAAAEVLTLVEKLGPLGPPEEEFRRVYRFLHYNEAKRVIRVAEELLQAKERIDHALLVKNNAWKYVVVAFDAWLARARVFYLAAGIVEGTLKSRLDERLTLAFGENWHESADAVPSSVFERIEKEEARQRLAAAQRLLEETGEPDSLEKARELLQEVQAHLASPMPPGVFQSGSEFIAHLPFSQLRSFFQAKRLWGRGPNLQTIFRPTAGATTVLKSEVDDALKAVHEMRNEVAHYRPSGRLSFLEGLFALARLAQWLDVDLQWVYGSIDSRQSTELSHLLESRYAATYLEAQKKNAKCVGNDCAIGMPFDLLLDKAPTGSGGTALVDGVSLACMYHRVQVRAVVHHSPWP